MCNRIGLHDREKWLLINRFCLGKEKKQQNKLRHDQPPPVLQPRLPPGASGCAAAGNATTPDPPWFHHKGAELRVIRTRWRVRKLREADASMCLSDEDDEDEDVAPPDLFSAGMSSVMVARKHLCLWYSVTAIIKSITEAVLFFFFYFSFFSWPQRLFADYRRPPESCSFTLSFSHSFFLWRSAADESFSNSRENNIDLEEFHLSLTAGDDHVHQNDFECNGDLIQGGRRRGRRERERGGWRTALSEALQRGASPVQTCCNLTSED